MESYFYDVIEYIIKLYHTISMVSLKIKYVYKKIMSQSIL